MKKLPAIEKKQIARPHKNRKVKTKGRKNCKNCSFTNFLFLLRVHLNFSAVNMKQ